MKCKIDKIDKYTKGKRDLDIINFDYFGRKVSTAVTPKAKSFLKIDEFYIGQEINVVKNVKNNVIVYVITKVFGNE